MKKSIIMPAVLLVGMVHVGVMFGDVAKSDASKSPSAVEILGILADSGAKAIPDVLSVGNDVIKLIPLAKTMDGKLKTLKTERKTLKANKEPDQKALDKNLLEINILTTNLTTLLSGITARLLHLLKGAFPLLDLAVAKNDKAKDVLVKFKDAFKTISSITKSINQVNSVMYEKMVKDLDALDPVKAKEAEAEKQTLKEEQIEI